MGYKQKLKRLADTIRDQEEHLTTEQATKNVLVEPFIRILGYNTSDAKEVRPESDAEMSTFKGKKVDYAILKHGKPQFLIECKKFGTDLHGKKVIKQLWDYFNAVKQARIAILTDGRLYRFYSDLETKHLMDSEPFMEFSLLDIDIDKTTLDKLKCLTKSDFNLNKLLQGGEDFRAKMQIVSILRSELHSPDDYFVKFLVSKACSGKKPQVKMKHFASVAQEAFVQFIREVTDEGVKSVVKPPKKPTDVVEEGPGGIKTTLEELEGFGIVKSILHQVVDPSRIHRRDRISYFAILLDNKVNKPICRLHFNRPEKKYIGLFDAKKREKMEEIDGPDGIYRYSAELKETVSRYEGKSR